MTILFSSDDGSGCFAAKFFALCPVVVGVLGMAVFLSKDADADETHEHALAELVEDSLQVRRPLSDFVNSAEPISLEGSRSGIDLEIPLNPRIELVGGEVEIDYLHAVGIRSDRSRLRVRWDDREIASGRIGGLRREGRLSGRLPSDEPSVDRYRLRISAEQRNDGSADALLDSDEAEIEPWTQVDPAKSWIALDYRLRPLKPRLDEVRTLVDQRLWNQYTLTVVTAPIYATGQAHLKWGARAVQRIALWHGDRPLSVRHDDRLSPVGDELVIGTRDELIGILPQNFCDHITSSFIGVYPHPNDERHFLLVLSGTETEGVDRAVRAFVFHSEKMPSLPRIDVSHWNIGAKDPAPTGHIESRRLQMPDLARWSREGFPGATGRPVVAGCDLWVAHRDSETIACAWMIAGKLAQVAGDLVTTLDVVDKEPRPGRHWIALGDRDALPGSLVEKSPLANLFGPGELMGRQGVLTQFESPLKPGRAAGFITAGDRVLLEERVNEMIRPEFWSTLHGDTVTWEPGGDSARFQRLAASFEIGEPGWLLRFWRLVKAVPWLSLLFGAAGAAIVFWLLRQPVHDPDPAAVGVTKRNGNRRVSRGKRLREAARRTARLDKLSRHHG
ncbi:MAG: cellulose biosynthesis cyclic di-GMP-binding regulatory protein BcsB [Verrucomicrobiae bacterium]|nr:cellulose biosynthesis cyclic di-GMP-binding regulatory protein BcsB [Verrucomicrobiae bacterium]